MRPEKLYLADVVEAADAISSYVQGLTRESFLTDEMRRSCYGYEANHHR